MEEEIDEETVSAMEELVLLDIVDDRDAATEAILGDDESIDFEADCIWTEPVRLMISKLFNQCNSPIELRANAVG